MYRILVVEEEETVVQQLDLMLKPEYEVVAFRTAGDMMKWLMEETADLILMDYNLPVQNGLDALKHLREQEELAAIPVIILTEEKNASIEVPCLMAGAKDMLLKPLTPEIVRMRVARILELGALKEFMKRKLEENNKQVESVVLQAITTMANTVDAKDDYTGEHSIRVAKFAALIAEELSWDDEQVRDLYYAGLLHDIGKISVPDVIIRKPSALNDTEWRTMKSHTTIGADILKDIHIVKMAAEVALYHHEWYNGTGYPTGVAREEIPIEARIVGIADAYDAMTSNRVYRKALDIETVKGEFIRCRGTQFDPELADLMVRMIEENVLAREPRIINTPVAIQPDAAEESNRLLYRFMEVNNQEAKKEAMQDALTGLYNRNYAERQVNEMLAKEAAGVYLMVDLDNFKHINDCFGHVIGDSALRIVTETLLENTPNDTVVSRIGGDEFAVFLPGMVTRAAVEEQCMLILNAYNRMVAGSEQLSGTSLSIGVAGAPDDGSNYQELYSAADKALYLAKRNGKNRYCFFKDNVTPVTGDREMVIDIHQLELLIRDRRNFSGSYQVQYQEFQRIYNFIARCVERTNQEVQLMMASLKNPNQETRELLEEEMTILEQAVVSSLRRNDVCTKYSDTQILVVLLDINNQNMEIVTKRVMGKYAAARKHEGFEVLFEQMQVEGRNVDRKPVAGE